MEIERLVSADRQRRTHTRSRKGCLQCKKRHVKCDERLPVCSRCETSGKQCSLSRAVEDNCWPTQRSILPSKQTSCVSRAALDDVARLNGPNCRFSECDTHLSIPSSPSHRPLPIEDMELLYNVLRTGQDALSFDMDDDIRLGFSFPYVLHIVLSLSALRSYDRQPARKELLVRAAQHQDRALALVRPHMVNLDQHNVQAVWRFAFLVSISALGQPLYRPENRSHDTSCDAIEDIIQSFNMVRGVRFVSEAQSRLSGEPYSGGGGPDLNDEDPWQQGLSVKYPPYQTIRQLVVDHCAIEPERLVCLDALRKVFSFISLIEDSPGLHASARLFQIWPIELDQRFIDLMSARRPVALLILGYYSALLLLRSGDEWPFAAWPTIILKGVIEVLGEEWAAYLRWPVERVLGVHL